MVHKAQVRKPISAPSVSAQYVVHTFAHPSLHNIVAVKI